MKLQYKISAIIVLFFATLTHAETTWTTGTYSNNQDTRQELTVPGASRIIVNIQGITERDYDFIYIYDNNGHRIKRFHGRINEEFTINTSTVTARLKTDRSVTLSGVTVTVRLAPPPSLSTTWTTGTYGNNEHRQQVLSIPNATNLKVTVIGETERRYDFIYIYDANGNKIRTLDGSINETFTVTGSQINAKLTSDLSVTKSGVTVSIEVPTAPADTQKPTITLNGSTTQTLAIGDTYTDAGATANDNIDGNITANITANNSVNTNIAGTYSVTYNVSDAAGNEADEVRRTVVVTTDSSSTTWTTGTYSDNEDRQQVLSIPNATNLKVTVIGKTERRYDFIYIYDANGNEIRKLDGSINETFIVAGSQITVKLTSDSSLTEEGATVSIEASTVPADTQKPTITLSGSTTQTLAIGDTYTDAGATANDNIDGNITANITVNNFVNTSIAGTYSVTYNVSDAAGNEADEVRRTIVVQNSTPSKVFAFFADEHNDFNNTTTGEGSGNRVLQIDIEDMSIVNSLDVPGILGHHADNGYNSKIYGIPKGSNFVNVIELRRDVNNTTSMNVTKQIQLIHRPRSSDAYNSRFNVVLIVAKNRPMGSFINVETDEVVGTLGEEIDCTLTDGTMLLSHDDANTAEGALKYQCTNNDNDHGGDQVSGHPYWLTDDIAAIVDRTNKQISVYRVSQVNNRLQATLMNRVTTRTSIHQIVPRDRSRLPANQQSDFYAIEEGRHANRADFTGGVAHALIHLRLNDNGLQLIRRMDLQRTQVLPKAKSERILNSCINIYRATAEQALTGPSAERERRYNALFNREGITRNTDQDINNDFPVDCFYPGIPGGHNADFAPNNKHLYVGMAGGAMSVVDVNRWKIANNLDIGIRTGPGHTCFSEQNNVALTSNHGFSDIFGNKAMTRSIRYINSERPIAYYWISLPFDRENITNTAVSHTCHIDASGDNYYNFFVDGGVFYKIDLTGVFNNPTNGQSDLVVDSLYTGGMPIQGSYINLRDIQQK